MEFFRYLNVLKKYLPLIVLLTALGAGSAYAFSKRQHKVYSATATLSINAAAPAAIIPYLNSAVSGATGVAPVEQLASSYSFFLKTRSFDGSVAQRLRLNNVSPGQLGGAVSSALVPGTNYFQITVTWGDPVLAATIANGIATAFIDENKAQQAATQGAQSGSELSAAINYFRGQITIAQKQYDALLHNPRSSLVRVQAAQDRFNSVSDEYYRLLGTAGANAQQNSTNSASKQDDAIPSSVPISPKVTQNTLFGLLAGLLVGVALAFGLDYLDYSLRTPEDVERLLGQAPLGLLGVIGVDSPKGRRGLFGLFGRRHKPAPAPAPAPAAMMANSMSNGNGANGHDMAQLEQLTAFPVLNPQLVTLNHPKAPITEAFRTLRTNIEFSSLDKQIKSLVVTSSVPGEGKSTIASNLAVAMAQAGKRVILVDADLRRPSVGRIFGLKTATGFTTVLLARENRAGAIDRALQATMVPNLLVMTSGPHPPNPAELLASQSATEVLRELEARSDLVILDTPPMGPLTDAVVLSARVGGTIVVARAASTRRTVVGNSVNTLRKVGGNVLGTVLNMVDLKGIGSYSYYYYYSSEYYYGREETAPTGGTRR